MTESQLDRYIIAAFVCGFLGLLGGIYYGFYCSEDAVALVYPDAWKQYESTWSKALEKRTVYQILRSDYFRHNVT
jgi:hypothetical protein